MTGEFHVSKIRILDMKHSSFRYRKFPLKFWYPEFEFLISKIGIFEFQLWISKIPVIFFISSIRILDIQNYSGISDKKNCRWIFDIQNSNSWYKKFLFWLSKIQREFFLSEIRIFDIRNSAVILDVENSNAWYENFEYYRYKEFECLISEMIGFSVDSACYTCLQH
jgi:hypothetical protein